jgi:hypothetical protein
MTDSQLLTPRQLSELLQVPMQTLANWRWRGEGPKFIKLGEGRTAPVRYRPESVAAYLDAQQAGGDAA